jgi:serine/threonine protein kinase/TPR repeat protein
MLSAGTVLANRYRVVRPLGGGGMKMVYLVEDTRLANRLCALAEMIDSFTDPKEAQNAAIAFQREAEMLANLAHDRIVRVYDKFSEGNRHFLVMEYVEGYTLEQKLAAAPRKRLDEKFVSDAGLQILDALEYLHLRKPAVIYRDLKPANVIITPDGRVKLIDFGIARIFVPKKTATMVGTQGYAPPEQYEGKAEPRSDLYSFGAMLHHLVTGRDPTQFAPFSFPPVRSDVPSCRRELADCIDTCLKDKPAERPPNASAVRNMLLGTARSHRAVSVAAPPSHPIPSPPSAPTALVSAPSVTLVTPCFNCQKDIPTDARFCPYCKVNIPPLSDVSAVPRSAATAIRRVATAALAVTVSLLVLLLAFPGFPFLLSEWPSAELGNTEDQLALANAYFSGRQLAPDYRSAAYWYGRAAQAGDQYAQWQAGRIYEQGIGVAPNYSRAFNLLNLASEHDDSPATAQAQRELAELYRYGIGTEQNFETALTWYKKAAVQHDGIAEAELALIYDSGFFKNSTTILCPACSVDSLVNRDSTSARTFALNALKDLQTESEQGSSDSAWFLYQNYRFLLNISSGKSKWSREREKPKSEWLRMAIADGIVDAIAYIANKESAAKWNNDSTISKMVALLRLRANLDDSGAAYGLSLCYESGLGVNEDNEDALAWLKKAATDGYPPAEYYLGVDYESGHRVAQADGQALNWYLKAARAGDRRAENALGDIYSNVWKIGDISPLRDIVDEHQLKSAPPADYAEAAKWYRREILSYDQFEWDRAFPLAYAEEMSGRYVEAFNSYRIVAESSGTDEAWDAEYRLGYMYEHGEGVTKNLNYALDRYWNLGFGLGRKLKKCRAAACRVMYELTFSEDCPSDFVGRSENLRNWPCGELAEQNDADAEYVQGWLSEHHCDLVAYLSEQDRLEQEDRELEIAAQMFLKSARQGNRSAACAIAGMYRKGLGVERDAAEAQHWQAQCQLGS